MKNCLKCKIKYSKTAFHKNKNYEDGLAKYCKICMKIISKKRYKEKREHILKVNSEWRNNNREYFRNLVNSWRKNNRDKVRLYCNNRNSIQRGSFGKLKQDEWEQIKKDFKYMCAICGKKEPEIKLTIDHIIPVSKGGSNLIENIQPLCRLCNSIKGNR